MRYDDEEIQEKAEKIADFCNEIVELGREHNLYTEELYESAVNLIGWTFRDNLDEEEVREVVRDIHMILTQIFENRRKKKLNEYL